MSIFENADKRLGLFLKICTAIGIAIAFLTFFAWKSDLEVLAAEYHSDKEGILKRELVKTIRECKRDYGPNYSKAPDKLSQQMCEDAEDEYKIKYGGKE